jgi:hypothetical protein
VSCEATRLKNTHIQSADYFLYFFRWLLFFLIKNKMKKSTLGASASLATQITNTYTFAFATTRCVALKKRELKKIYLKNQLTAAATAALSCVPNVAVFCTQKCISGDENQSCIFSLCAFP